MKKLYIFCSKVMVYWIEIPLAILLTIAIYFNDKSNSLLKLYPLIVLCSLAILFVFVYFFRMIKIGYDEIRYIGLYSSRDRAIITEGKTLSLTIINKGIVKISLIGNDGIPPSFSWVKDSEPMRDICLFRGKLIGGNRTARRILKFFGADGACIRDIFEKESYKKALENVTVSNGEDDGYLKINIRFDATI